MADIIPKDINGKFDPLAFVRTTWPVLVTLIGLVFWFGGRMESPDQKRERIELVCGQMISERVPPAEVLRRLERIEQRLDSFIALAHSHSEAP